MGGNTTKMAEGAAEMRVFRPLRFSADEIRIQKSGGMFQV